MELHALRRSLVCGLLMKRSNGLNLLSVKRISGDSLQNMCIHCRACCSKLTSQLLMHFTWGLLPLSRSLTLSLSRAVPRLHFPDNTIEKGKEMKQRLHCLIKSTLHHVPFRRTQKPSWSAVCCAYKGNVFEERSLAALSLFFFKHSTYLCFNNTSSIKTKTHHYPWTFKKQFSALLAHSSVLVLMRSKQANIDSENCEERTAARALLFALSVRPSLGGRCTVTFCLISGQLLAVTLLTSHFPPSVLPCSWVSTSWWC